MNKIFSIITLGILTTNIYSMDVIFPFFRGSENTKTERLQQENQELNDKIDELKSSNRLVSTIAKNAINKSDQLVKQVDTLSKTSIKLSEENFALKKLIQDIKNIITDSEESNKNQAILDLINTNETK